MWSYYLFMALLITTLVLWAIIALRDDTRDHEERPASQDRQAPESPDKPKT